MAAIAEMLGMSLQKFRCILRVHPYKIESSNCSNDVQLLKEGDIVDLFKNHLTRESKKDGDYVDLKVSDNEPWNLRKYHQYQFIIQTKRGKIVEIFEDEEFANERFDSYERQELTTKPWTKWTR